MSSPGRAPADLAGPGQAGLQRLTSDAALAGCGLSLGRITLPKPLPQPARRHSLDDSLARPQPRKSVSFRLRARNPGPAYGSPSPPAAREPRSTSAPRSLPAPAASTPVDYARDEAVVVRRLFQAVQGQGVRLPNSSPEPLPHTYPGRRPQPRRGVRQATPANSAALLDLARRHDQQQQQQLVAGAAAVRPESWDRGGLAVTDQLAGGGVAHAMRGGGRSPPSPYDILAPARLRLALSCASGVAVLPPHPAQRAGQQAAAHAAAGWGQGAAAFPTAAAAELMAASPTRQQQLLGWGQPTHPPLEWLPGAGAPPPSFQAATAAAREGLPAPHPGRGEAPASRPGPAHATASAAAAEPAGRPQHGLAAPARGARQPASPPPSPPPPAPSAELPLPPSFVQHPQPHGLEAGGAPAPPMPRADGTQPPTSPLLPEHHGGASFELVHRMLASLHLPDTTNSAAAAPTATRSETAQGAASGWEQRPASRQLFAFSSPHGSGAAALAAPYYARASQPLPAPGVSAVRHAHQPSPPVQPPPTASTAWPFDEALARRSPARSSAQRLGRAGDEPLPPPAASLQSARVAWLGSVARAAAQGRAVAGEELDVLGLELEEAGRERRLAEAYLLGAALGLPGRRLERLHAVACASGAEPAVTTALLAQLEDRLRLRAALRALRLAAEARAHLVDLLHSRHEATGPGVAAAWACWRGAASSRVALRDRISASAVARRRLLTARALLGWQAAARRRVESRQRGAFAISTASTSRLRRCLRAWLQLCRRYRSLRSAVGQCRTVRLRRLLTGWLGAARHQAVASGQRGLAAAYLRSRLLLSALAHWRCLHVRRSLARAWEAALARRRELQVLGRAMRVWHFYARRCRQLIRQLARQHAATSGGAVAVLDESSLPAPLQLAALPSRVERLLSAARGFMLAMSDELLHLRAFLRFRARPPPAPPRAAHLRAAAVEVAARSAAGAGTTGLGGRGRGARSDAGGISGFGAGGRGAAAAAAATSPPSPRLLISGQWQHKQQVLLLLAQLRQVERLEAEVEDQLQAAERDGRAARLGLQQQSAELQGRLQQSREALAAAQKQQLEHQAALVDLDHEAHAVAGYLARCRATSDASEERLRAVEEELAGAEAHQQEAAAMALAAADRESAAEQALQRATAELEAAAQSRPPPPPPPPDAVRGAEAERRERGRLLTAQRRLSEALHVKAALMKHLQEVQAAAAAAPRYAAQRHALRLGEAQAKAVEAAMVVSLAEREAQELTAAVDSLSRTAREAEAASLRGHAAAVAAATDATSTARLAVAVAAEQHATAAGGARSAAAAAQRALEAVATLRLRLHGLRGAHAEGRAPDPAHQAVLVEPLQARQRQLAADLRACRAGAEAAHAGMQAAMAAVAQLPPQVEAAELSYRAQLLQLQPARSRLALSCSQLRGRLEAYPSELVRHLQRLVDVHGIEACQDASGEWSVQHLPPDWERLLRPGLLAGSDWEEEEAHSGPSSPVAWGGRAARPPSPTAASAALHAALSSPGHDDAAQHDPTQPISVQHTADGAGGGVGRRGSSPRERLAHKRGAAPPPPGASSASSPAHRALVPGGGGSAYSSPELQRQRKRVARSLQYQGPGSGGLFNGDGGPWLLAGAASPPPGDGGRAAAAHAAARSPARSPLRSFERVLGRPLGGDQDDSSSGGSATSHGGEGGSPRCTPAGKARVLARPHPSQPGEPAAQPAAAAPANDARADEVRAGGSGGRQWGAGWLLAHSAGSADDDDVQALQLQAQQRLHQLQVQQQQRQQPQGQQLAFVPGRIEAPGAEQLGEAHRRQQAGWTASSGDQGDGAQGQQREQLDVPGSSSSSGAGQGRAWAGQRNELHQQQREGSATPDSDDGLHAGGQQQLAAAAWQHDSMGSSAGEPAGVHDQRLAGSTASDDSRPNSEHLNCEAPTAGDAGAGSARWAGGQSRAAGAPAAAAADAPAPGAYVARSVEDAARLFYLRKLYRRTIMALRTSATRLNALAACLRRTSREARLRWALSQLWLQASEPRSLAAAFAAASGRVRCLAHWRRVVLTRRQRAEAVRLARRAGGARVLRGCLQAWAAWRCAKEARRDVWSVARKQHLRWLLRRWRRGLQALQVLARWNARAQQACSRSGLRRTLRHWRHVVRSRALLRRVFARAEQLWDEHTDALRVLGSEFGLLAEAFGRLRRYHAHRSCKRRERINEHAAAVFRESLLRVRAFGAWRAAVSDASHERFLAGLTAKLMRAWHRFARAQREQPRSLCSLRRRLRALGYAGGEAGIRRRWLLRCAVLAMASPLAQSRRCYRRSLLARTLAALLAVPAQRHSVACGHADAWRLGSWRRTLLRSWHVAAVSCARARRDLAEAEAWNRRRMRHLLFAAWQQRTESRRQKRQWASIAALHLERTRAARALRRLYGNAYGSWQAAARHDAARALRRCVAAWHALSAAVRAQRDALVRVLQLSVDGPDQGALLRNEPRPRAAVTGTLLPPAQPQAAAPSIPSAGRHRGDCATTVAPKPSAAASCSRAARQPLGPAVQPPGATRCAHRRPKLAALGAAVESPQVLLVHQDGAPAALGLHPLESSCSWAGSETPWSSCSWAGSETPQGSCSSTDVPYDSHGPAEQPSGWRGLPSSVRHMDHATRRLWRHYAQWQLAEHWHRRQALSRVLRALRLCVDRSG